MQLDPVGFFDSGWGGLSTLIAARAALPAENFCYVADCGNAPYGDQTHEFIVDRAFGIARFLFTQQKVKALVIACNTATAEAVDCLREHYPDKIILGVEPAIKPAIEASKNKIVGMISTNKTAHSNRYHLLLERFASQATVFSQGCPGLMECVERGEFTADSTRTLLHQYLDPMLKAGIDSLVLGCTHYPFLSQMIAEIVGPNVTLYDSSPAVARHLEHRLKENGRLNRSTVQGQTIFFVSDLNQERQNVARRLWKAAMRFENLPV
ncbi:MAG: glutamate racemase [Candidatus Aphodousia sp.]|nr:glutamate racemase [Sutterella sp.]MDY2899940.1 glutamate racemase [Candidatus Aphodousia sp.]